MQYRAIYNQTSDDVKHWKYMKKTKVNGKWRYYYDKETASKDVDKAVTTAQNALDVAVAETSRAADEKIYDAAYKATQVETTARLQDIDRKVPEGVNRTAQRFVTNVVGSLKLLSINVLKKLNRGGDGTADNRLIAKVEEGKQWLSERLGIN